MANPPAELYMQRAIELAALGQGHVSPNPMVGCVIVHQDQIIGQGWHKQYGGPHAEVNAINSVENPELLPQSTAYVTLEPCSHYGKTPPCAKLLIEKKVGKVVAATLDPNPKVAGRGMRMLQEASIATETGLLQEAAQHQNRRFFTSMTQQRPHIILKWAQTANGMVARANFDSKWISGQQSRQLVHKWRAQEDAIWVGANTAMHDDPQLNVRDWTGPDPLRIVSSRAANLPAHLKLFNGSVPTLWLHTDAQAAPPTTEKPNLQVVSLPTKNFLPQALHHLHSQGVQSVIVEGGSKLLKMFIEQNFWDEARVFTAPAVFEQGIAAPQLANSQLGHQENIGADVLQWYQRQA